MSSVSQSEQAASKSTNLDPHEQRLHNIAYQWTQDVPVPLVYRLVLTLLLLAGIEYGVYRLSWKAMMNQIVLTSTVESLEASRNGGIAFPSVLIASITGDRSSPQFGTSWKCRMKNRQDGTDGTDCAGSLTSHKTDVGLNVTYYDGHSGSATRFKSGDYLEIQAFFNFDPSVTQGWYNSVYSPTVLIGLRPPEMPQPLPTSWDAFWQDSRSIPAAGYHHLSIHRRSFTFIDGTVDTGYDITETLVTPTADLSVCAVSTVGCAMTVAIAYNDIQHSRVVQQYRMDNKSLASAIIALAGTPVMLANITCAFWGWLRAKALHSSYKLPSIGFFEGLVPSLSGPASGRYQKLAVSKWEETQVNPRMDVT